jgi:hypothetical protein
VGYILVRSIGQVMNTEPSHGQGEWITNVIRGYFYSVSKYTLKWFSVYRVHLDIDPSIYIYMNAISTI